MGGGLLDLAAYGAQDVYLTGNPQITFFKTVYRRHTNFSMESVKQTWVGNPNDDNNRAECTLSRTGDLVSGIHFEVQFSNASISISNYIKDVSVEIGGQLIDRQTGQFMESYAKLTNKRPPNSIFSRTTLLDRTGNNNIFSDQMTYFIPLMFWFCRHPGSALPLVALQYHDIKIILNTGSNNGTGFTSKNDIYVDYIYLDTDERRRFAEKSHEYLIEQVQYKKFSTTNTTRFDIGFLNHPVKELIWVTDVKNGASFENISADKGVIDIGESSEDAVDTINNNFDSLIEDMVSLFTQFIYHNYLEIKNLKHRIIDEGGTRNDYGDINALGDMIDELVSINFNIMVKNQFGVYFRENGEYQSIPEGVYTRNYDDLEKSSNREQYLEDIETYLSDLYNDWITFALNSRDPIFGPHYNLGPKFNIKNVGQINTTAGSNTEKGDVATWKIALNGNDRISERDPGYFCRKQISDHHSGSFTTSSESDGHITEKNQDYDLYNIAVYSFALRPEELQPSGTCNFSRIDNAELITSGPIDDYVGNSFTVYAINYNILRVMSGMGGLAYAN